MKLLLYKRTLGRRFSGGALATSLGCSIVTPNRRPRTHELPVLIINYGRRVPPFWYNPDCHKWLNHPRLIEQAADKLKCLEKLFAENIPTVQFTSVQDIAIKWLHEGNTVYARTMLNASGGRGIVVMPPGVGQLTPAPLYTKRFHKLREFRVHVGRRGGEDILIDYTKKRRRTGETPDRNIRCYEGGWVFCRNNVTPDENLVALAAQAIEVLSLDFGAVDILQKRNGKSVVCEVNTAPGMQGTTLERYTAFFKEYARWTSEQSY